MRKFLAFAVAAACCCGASGVFAADMALPPPPVAAPTIWTGCYIGGNVGGGWNAISGFDPTNMVPVGNANGSGFIGGGQVGCDYQFNAFVVGIEGMFEGSSIKGSAPGLELPGTFMNSASIPWLATVTGRAGFAVMPTALIYAKGGGAFVKDSIVSTTIATGAAFDSSNYIADGWTVGGGLEYMFLPHWSVFVEYDYMNLGTTTRSFTLTAPPPPTLPFNITQSVQAVVAGVNFRY
jgi:outer membrane immunogenic protein